MIEEYQAFRFVPDVNQLRSYEIDRIPIDLDRPARMEWKPYSEFVNDFLAWLRERGFHPRLRLTGGMGAHVIIDLRVNRVAAAYVRPFPEAKLTSYDPRVRSKWIQLVGSNPHLLYEERKPESFDLIEEVFEKWSWVSEQYVKLGPDSFMQMYCRA